MRTASLRTLASGIVVAGSALGAVAAARAGAGTPDAAHGARAIAADAAEPLAGARVLLGGRNDHAAAPWPGGRPHAFYFTRAAYSGYGRRGWGGGSWAIDYPKADSQFLLVVNRLVDIDAYPDAHAMTLDDPDLRRFPFLYALEVGAMSLGPAEVRGLREYLLAGGFLVIDDFWGTREWANFEREIRQVLPEFDIVELPMEHEIFSTFYDIEKIEQVPSITNIRYRGQTHEQDGFVPHVRGIFDDHGRLLVVINWNTDMGDAWEWAEQPDYPLRYSTFAMQMGVNLIVYALSH